MSSAQAVLPRKNSMETAWANYTHCRSTRMIFKHCNNCYSIHSKRIQEIRSELLTLSSGLRPPMGNSLIQINSVFECSYSESFPALAFFQYPCSLPNTIKLDRVRESFVDIMLEGWPTFCKEETSGTFARYCCNFSPRMEFCYDNAVFVLHY